MRMNGKKLTALLGTAVLAMGILAGCGSSATETTAAGTAAPATTAETATESSAASGETKDQAAAEAENAPSADLSGAISTVSYTHLDVYKRQNLMCTFTIIGLSVVNVNRQKHNKIQGGRIL